jgi:hypothetical protein
MTAVDAVGAPSDQEDERVVLEKLDALLAAYPPARTATVDFLGAQFDAGLAFINFPPGYGGLGLSRTLQSLIIANLRETGAPLLAARNPIGYGMVAPTLLTTGTE